MQLDTLIADALKTPNPLTELRQQIIRLRASGIEKDVIIAELGALRSTNITEEEDDLILEALDLLYGWCSSFMRID